VSSSSPSKDGEALRFKALTLDDGGSRFDKIEPMSEFKGLCAPGMISSDMGTDNEVQEIKVDK
jgi:hypothetical protein